VILSSGRRPAPYGIFTADKHGESTVDLPPEHIRVISIETLSSDYPSEQMSWNVDKAEKIPTNYVFKISKKIL
jgi:hypothetical protein